jgi:hypothetical protein
MPVYDKAKWHYDGRGWRESTGLPDYQAYVHDLYSEEFAEDCQKDIKAFKARNLTGPKVHERCNGSLADIDLNDEGNAFAQVYFDLKKGKYLKDYGELWWAHCPPSTTWRTRGRITKS